MAWLLLMTLCGGLSAGEVEVWNTGRGGNRASELLSRLKNDVEPKRPDLVILLVGTNDLLNSKKAVSLEVYRENLLKLVTRLQRLPTAVLLVTIPPCHPPDLFLRHSQAFYEPEGPNGRVEAGNRMIREVAAQTGVPVVDLFERFTKEGQIGEGAASYLRNAANSGRRDGVHPTADAYRAMAGWIAEAITAHHLPASRVVCLGDSITLGAGVKGEGTVEGESYPAQLRFILRSRVQPSGSH